MEAYGSRMEAYGAWPGLAKAWPGLVFSFHEKGRCLPLIGKDKICPYTPEKALVYIYTNKNTDKYFPASLHEQQKYVNELSAKWA